MTRIGSSDKHTSVAWELGDRHVGHNWRKTKWQPSAHCSTRKERAAKREKRAARKIRGADE